MGSEGERRRLICDAEEVEDAEGSADEDEEDIGKEGDIGEGGGGRQD